MQVQGPLLLRRQEAREHPKLLSLEEVRRVVPSRDEGLTLEEEVRQRLLDSGGP